MDPEPIFKKKLPNLSGRYEVDQSYHKCENICFKLTSINVLKTSESQVCIGKTE